MRETPFDALKHPTQVREVCEQILAADKGIIAWLTTQEHYVQELDGSLQKLLPHLTATAELVADLVSLTVAMRELGDCFGGDRLKDRNRIGRAVKRGAPLVPYGVHERPMTEVPITDLDGCSDQAPVVSLLQAGFWSRTGGRGNPEDEHVQGGHAYDGAAGFVRANRRRMRGYLNASPPRMSAHLNVIHEHSIPFVFTGQPWQPTRTLAEAQWRGVRLLKAGADADFSSGARRTT